MMLWNKTLAIFTCMDEEMGPQTSSNMLWGETLAISTCLDEEMGPQTSPNDVVG